MFQFNKKTRFKPNTDMMIECHHVSKRYSQGFGLKQISLNLPNAGMGFLIGHSGAGKSTLIKLIIQQEQSSSGVLQVNQQVFLPNHRGGQAVSKLRKSIGIILQNPQLLQKETALYNTALPLMISGWSQTNTLSRARAALNKVNLADKMHLPVYCLSAGEQHRVGIARAIVNKPTLLIADEPTANLDPSLSMEMIELLSAFNQMGVTVLIATHDLHLIPSDVKHLFVLERGELVEQSGT